MSPGPTFKSRRDRGPIIPGSSINGVVKSRRRIPRACDRCRLKKSKCDGDRQCKTCRLSDSPCIYQLRRKSGTKNYYGHMFDIFDEALRRLYWACRYKTDFPGIVPDETNGIVSANVILEGLGLTGFSQESGRMDNQSFVRKKSSGHRRASQSSTASSTASDTAASNTTSALSETCLNSGSSNMASFANIQPRLNPTSVPVAPAQTSIPSSSISDPSNVSSSAEQSRESSNQPSAIEFSFPELLNDVSAFDVSDFIPTNDINSSLSYKNQVRNHLGIDTHGLLLPNQTSHGSEFHSGLQHAITNGYPTQFYGFEEGYGEHFTQTCHPTYLAPWSEIPVLHSI